VRNEIHSRCSLRRDDSSSIVPRSARDLLRSVMTIPAGREMLLDNRILQRTDPKEHCLDTYKRSHCQVKSVCREPGTGDWQPSGTVDRTRCGGDRHLEDPGQAQNAESEEKS